VFSTCAGATVLATATIALFEAPLAPSPLPETQNAATKTSPRSAPPRYGFIYFFCFIFKNLIFFKTLFNFYFKLLPYFEPAPLF
jgi:heme/copper-type cytochrome/quinol oxidase subunit 3